jgi:hypothetical protein
MRDYSQGMEARYRSEAIREKSKPGKHEPINRHVIMIIKPIDRSAYDDGILLCAFLADTMCNRWLTPNASYEATVGVWRHL